ncbi:MAG: hypothetical protein IKC26_05180 [Clostridia bacterium]|nr:hypothetical protein [Clostridia bacterium]
MTDFLISYIPSLIVAALLALIPANMAKKKGRSFFGWWVYGCCLFIVAIIHAALISPKYNTAATAKTTTGKGQYVKTAILMILSVILIEATDSWFYNATGDVLLVFYILCAVFLLVKRNKATNVLLMLSWGVIFIQAFSELSSYGGAVMKLRSFLMLVAIGYLFIVMLIGAIPSKRVTALRMLKARALPGVLALISWFIVVISILSDRYVDGAVFFGDWLGGFLRVMSIFSLGKSLCQAYGVDHPESVATSYAASTSYSSSATASYQSQSTPTSTYTAATTPAPASTYTPTSTLATSDPEPNPLDEEPEDEPTYTPEPEPKPAPVPKRNTGSTAEAPKAIPVTKAFSNDPVYVFEGAKGTHLTVYENKVILRKKPTDDADRVVEHSFLYSDLEKIDYVKGAAMLGSITFQEKDPNEYEAETPDWNVFFYDVMKLSNADVGRAVKLMKARCKEANS